MTRDRDTYRDTDRNDLFVVPYDKCALPLAAHIIAAIVGYAAGFIVLWLFYRETIFAIMAAAVVVPFAVYINIVSAKKKRLYNLIRQFQNLLDSLSVSLQSGGTDLGAFDRAVEDLSLMYSERADIVKETRLIAQKFRNRITIGEALTDFGERSGLEDIKVFAAVYSMVEGKGEKTRDIVIRTQKILSDKIEIQAEIRTLISGASMEINIIVMIPLLIVAVMGFMGGELMQALFEPSGHVVATIALILFAVSYILGKKISNIKL